MVSPPHQRGEHCEDCRDRWRRRRTGCCGCRKGSESCCRHRGLHRVRGRCIQPLWHVPLCMARRSSPSKHCSSRQGAVREIGNRRSLRNDRQINQPRKDKTIAVEGEGDVSYDRLVLATGWNYGDPGLPGSDLDGLYRVKDIRRAMEWDKVIEKSKSAVIVESGFIAMEMTSALRHRGPRRDRGRPRPVPDV